MKHIKIILVPDQRYPGPAGCKACHYQSDGLGCRDPNLSLFGRCFSHAHNGVFKDGGHYTIKASVSRNKREGKYRQRIWTTHDGYAIGRLPFARGHHG